MIRKNRHKTFKSFRPLPNTIGRVFIVLTAATVLLIGWNQAAGGQTESLSTADPAVITSEPTNFTSEASSTGLQHALHSPAENAPAVPSDETGTWVERYEKLADGLQMGRLDSEVADLFYQELNAALLGKRNHLRDVLTAATPAPSTQTGTPKKKAPSGPTGKGLEPQESQEPSTPARQEETRDQRVGIAEQLWLDLTALHNLRIQVLAHVSPELRNRVIGAGIDGVQAFKEELDYLSLTLRHRLYLLPQTGARVADRWMRAPLPVLLAVLQVVCAVYIFFWWRRWAAQGIPRLQRNIRDIRPRKPIHKRLNRMLWYLNRVRSPLEWFLFLAIIFNVIGTNEGLTYKLLWTKAKYILMAWFVVTLVDAMADRGAAGLRSHTATLRLRSIWLLALWVLAAGLGLDITEDLIGKGTIHAWVWTFSKISALPVLFLLIRWWRPEIYRQLETESQQPAYIQKVFKYRRGPKSYLWAAVGGGYLVGDKFRQWVLRGITAFEGGRYFIAYLARIEAVRVSEREGQQRQGDPISEEMQHRLYADDGSLVESVGQDTLERMDRLVERGRRGAAVIAAERGGGKTQLLDRLSARFDGKMVLLDCPPGGSNSFREAFRKALDLKASNLSPETISERLRENHVKVIGIDNLHRLSRPVLGGQRDIDQMAELIEAVQTDVFWFFGVDWAAWQYISRVRSNRLFLDDVLKLPLWTETQITELIEQRSDHAGILPDFSELILPRQFEDMDYDTIEERNRFGFYRILWNASDGNPAVALQLWSDSLRVAPDGRILVTLPQLPATDELESADITVLLLLRVIAQSGFANQDEISDSLRFSKPEVVAALRFALAREWVESVDGRYRLTWKWFRSVTRVLARQNLLVRRTLGE